MGTLLSGLRAALRRARDPEKAAPMQAYMKSAMPYHGVPASAARRVFRDVLAGADVSSAAAWRREVLGLWRGAEFREERYGALWLCGHKGARAHQTPEAMPLYEELIVAGAWWDYVDDLAAHRVGPIVLSHPGPMKRLMRSWSRSDDLWKRRTSIICQLGAKERTDLALLYDCIEPSLASREFFLRKAIGWALRQLAWRDPAEVRRYVKGMGDRLSPLSRREAIKNIGD
ncbi:MAG: DNA alkylation repair protein [Elusimicrobia bacterium]|nr:DNA alkylation repair protein [Elusimicrobiota bacterium]